MHVLLHRENGRLTIAIQCRKCSSLQRRGFRESPTNIFTVVARWVCNSVFRTNRRSRGKIWLNRQTDKVNYSNPRCACAPRVNKLWACKYTIHTCISYLRIRCLYNSSTMMQPIRKQNRKTASLQAKLLLHVTRPAATQYIGLAKADTVYAYNLWVKFSPYPLSRLPYASKPLQ